MAPYKRERSSSDDDSDNSSTESDDSSSEPESPDHVPQSSKSNKVCSDEGIRSQSDDKENSPAPEIKLKRGLMALLKPLSTDSGDFATGGLLSDTELPVVPLIEVNGFGLLPFPMIQSTFKAVKSLCKRSPPEIGGDILDETSAKKSYQLEPSQFKIGNEQFVRQVNDLIQSKIKTSLGISGATIYGRIFQLLITEKGDKITDPIVPAEESTNVFGTLVIQLPSVFEGGNLEVKHLNTSRVFGNSSAGSSTHCRFVAHFTSCPSESQEVTSGYRAALIYSLHWEGNEKKPSPYIAPNSTVELCKKLNQLTESTEVPFLCWGLEYEYSEKILRQNSGALSFFNGRDKNVVMGFKNAFDYDAQISGKDKWEMCIATANKRIEESGNCEPDWSGSCQDYHDFEENERSCDLEDFVPLITNSSVYKELSIPFSPTEDLINYHLPEIIPGKAKRRKRSESCEGFWGTKDLGDGCSGPDREEGSTMNRWYQKKVLVLWRSDRSLDLRCLSSIDEATSYVLNLLEKGEISEGQRGFDQLWQKREKICKDEAVARVLKMCHLLDQKDEAVVMLKMLHGDGISSEAMGKAIAETASRFPGVVILSEVKKIIRNTDESHIYDLVQFCGNFDQIEPVKILGILLNVVLKDGDCSTSLEYEDLMVENIDPRKCPGTTIVLKYMFDQNLLLGPELDTLISKIDDLANLLPAIILTIENRNKDILHYLLMRYLDLAYKINDDDIEENMTYRSKYRHSRMVEIGDIAITKIVKALIRAPQKCLTLIEPVSKTIDIVAGLSKKNKQQLLILPFVKETLIQYSNLGKNLPEHLQKACSIRMEFLREIVSKGEPQMNWHQPDASIPAYPEVEAFLRGPKQSMVFGKGHFKSITQAKGWAYNRREKGCFMTLNPSGVGRNAAVTITKTTGAFDEQVAAFKKNFMEYENLQKFLENRKIVSLTPPNKEGEGVNNLDEKENQEPKTKTDDEQLDLQPLKSSELPGSASESNPTEGPRQSSLLKFMVSRNQG